MRALWRSKGGRTLGREGRDVYADGERRHWCSSAAASRPVVSGASDGQSSQGSHSSTVCVLPASSQALRRDGSSDAPFWKRHAGLPRVMRAFGMTRSPARHPTRATRLATALATGWRRSEAFGWPVFEAAMVTHWPVRGFVALGWGRDLVDKIPKPAILTVSPSPRASAMAEITALTASSASALHREVLEARWAMRSELFIGAPSAECEEAVRGSQCTCEIAARRCAAGSS